MPEPAPVLPGYSVVRPLGSGGFADVFLYEQSMPRRRVAVKVLLPDVADADARQMFLAEATMMAQLSAHPDVVTVYEASIAADGRPYLVMEYCPDSYGGRYRTERLALTEVLPIALAVGSVLETAHRDGFLHRDVKPSNILHTTYGRPVLSDFGIAASIAAAEGQETRGLSVPWSAPEVIRGETHGTVKSEIYAFAATVYGLLAGRSPFEVPGKENTLEAIQRRILGRAPAAPLGRPDVPASLETALLRALSKDPGLRPASVLTVLRSLQLVETELGLRPSPLLLPNESVLEAPGPAALPVAQAPTASATTRRPRTRSSTRSHVSASTGSGAPEASARGRSVGGRSSVSGSRGRIDGTVVRASAGDARAGSRISRRSLVVGSSILAAVVLVVAAILVVPRLGGGSSIPRVAHISANTTSDAVEFTWSDPGLKRGDVYLVRVDGGSGTQQRSARFRLEKSAITGQACVTVAVVRAGTSGAPSASTCAGG
ncbi:hypothetical protein GCM10025780_06240 [Frondihabitans cladoniiphilus]|uniref:non-specific serine/threonine protein kinase n=1 Tax=Frondihabitans cladoniiphilus TaxID=715785 RepID=A0ABP8VML5_9MICO